LLVSDRVEKMLKEFYPIVVEVDYEARDEVELTAFLNHLLEFEFAKQIHVRRLYKVEGGEA